MKTSYDAAVVSTLNWTWPPGVELMSVVNPAIDGSSEVTCQFGVPGWVFSQATGFWTGAAHGLAAEAAPLSATVGTTIAAATSTTATIRWMPVSRRPATVPCHLHLL